MAPVKGEREILQVAGREVAITNPSKVYFPEAGITKLDVARYYVAVLRGTLQKGVGFSELSGAFTALVIYAAAIGVIGVAAIRRAVR